jgi:quercetin dioxygenase-like cupin family protein
MPRTAPPAGLSAGPLLDLVRETAADPARWASAVRFDAGTRYWARLPAPSGVDLWLLTWLPGQDTELHDHGDAAAAVCVVSGAVSEVRADRDGTLRSVQLRTGDAVWVPPGAVHDMGHAGEQPAVSLHAYSPRLDRMTFYEAGPYGLRATRTVRTSEPELSVAS